MRKRKLADFYLRKSAYSRAMTDPGIEYLRHVLQEKDWNAAELAHRAGVSHSTINRPLTTTNYAYAISRKTLQKVYRASGIDPAPFLEAAGEPLINLPEDIERVGNGDPAPTNGSKLVPVFDVAASAGFGAAVEYEAQAYSLAFPHAYLSKLTSSSPANLAIISVKGDSMEPTLLDDDIVLLDSSKTNLSFDGLFVLRFDDALHVKRIGRSAKRGHVTVLSDNAAFPPIEVATADVQAVGKVLWYGRKV